MNPASIFDLSPSEKLQLVEDLWDDLAATSEAVPVHDWQREELARRKANLVKNPASGLIGSSSRALTAMSRRTFMWSARTEPANSGSSPLGLPVITASV